MNDANPIRWDGAGHVRATSLGSLLRATDKPVKSYPVGRRCVGCGCVLSRYNPEWECAACSKS